ncbi:hypothetical protein IWQ61_007148 [Dispira simplex]|nr:hypothetical protein IWQ61_007148 [Dispira simplex]
MVSIVYPTLSDTTVCQSKIPSKPSHNQAVLSYPATDPKPLASVSSKPRRVSFNLRHNVVTHLPSKKLFDQLVHAKNYLQHNPHLLTGGLLSCARRTPAAPTIPNAPQSSGELHSTKEEEEEEEKKEVNPSDTGYSVHPRDLVVDKDNSKQVPLTEPPPTKSTSVHTLTRRSSLPKSFKIPKGRQPSEYWITRAGITLDTPLTAFVVKGGHLYTTETLPSRNLHLSSSPEGELRGVLKKTPTVYIQN